MLNLDREYIKAEKIFLSQFINSNRHRIDLSTVIKKTEID